MKPQRIKWRGDVWTFDAYQLHEAFLWGAYSHYFPGSSAPPLHPTTQAEYLIGGEMAHRGFIRVTARDPDPREIVRRLKQEHQLKRAEQARAA